MGALAEGAGSEITLGGANNRINSGTEGALFSKNGGVINFGGGTIVNKDNSADKGLTENDHKKVTPFYVEGNGKITFNGATKLDMYDGALVFGGDSDYSAAVGGAAI